MATSSRSPGPEIAHRLGPSHQDLRGSRQSCPARRRDPADRYRRDRRGPLLDAFGSAAPEPEVRRTAMRAPPRRLAHDAPHDALLRSQDAATRRARRRPAARAADLRDPVPGQRREDESAAGLPERAKESRGAPLRSGSHDLDGRPPARRRRDIRMAERVRFRRRTQRREHADRSARAGPAAARHLARGSTARGPPDEPGGSPARRRSPPDPKPARTRPASFPRRRRIALPGSRATSDIALACLPRPAAPHAPRTRRRSPPRSPEPEPPRAPTRSPAAHRPDSRERPRRPPRPRPPVPAEGRTRRTRRRRPPRARRRSGTTRRGRWTRPECCRRRGPRGAGHGMAGQAERGPRRHPVARQPPATPPRTRPGAAPRARSPRPAARCTARSPTASARASVRRRTGRETRPSSRSASASRTPRRAPAPTPGSAGRGTGPARASRRRRRARREADT